MFLNNHVAEIDPDAKFDALLGWDSGVALAHCALHLDRATHGVNDTRKFRQEAVATERPGRKP